MRFLVLVLFYLLTSTAFSQLSSEVAQQLRLELAHQINGLRKEKQLPALTLDVVLKQAAQGHSEYMAQRGDLTHQEDVPNMKSPKNRVVMRGGKDFELIGENILMLQSPASRPVLSDVVAIAKEMAQLWRNSPPHYANILRKDYTLGDFGFAMDTVAGTIYATQLFGKRGTVVDHQLSANAFGITPAEAQCQERYRNYINLVYKLGNEVSMEGRVVKLYLSDKTVFDKLFPNDNDGIAVDLMQRRQFPCNADNRLDMSPVYDGILLPPVYRKEMLAGNEAQSDYRFIVTIGIIPDHLNPNDYQASVILLQNRQSCMYLWPVEVPKGSLAPITYEPEIYDPKDVVLENRGIIRSVELTYDFGNNDTIPRSFPIIPTVDGTVSSVYIHSYTSVDGDSINNVRLYTARARAIQRHLEKKLLLAKHQLHIDQRENWERMRYQLLYHGLNQLLQLPDHRIRTEYKQWDAPWKTLFARQRRSSATVNYVGVLPPGTPLRQTAETNLRTALLRKDWERANKSMALLYKERSFPDFLLDEPYYTVVKTQPELVQNCAALFALNPLKYQDNIGECLNSWLPLTAKLSPEAKRNLLYIYSVTYMDLLRVWDLPAKQLRNVMKPERLLPVRNTVAITDKKLLFNMHLTFLEYFGQINNSSGVSESFDYLINYFKTEELPLEKHIELALFCNHWSMYGLAIDRLKSCYEKGNYNAASLLILMKTMTLYRYQRDETFYKSIIEKAISMNRKGFCEWGYEYFQIMREPDLKTIYCKTCNR